MIGNKAMIEDWIEIEIKLGVNKDKMADRITPDMKISDQGFGQQRVGVCLSCPSDNSSPIFIAERKDPAQEEKIWLQPWESFEYPIADVQALNNLFALWDSGDVLFIVAR